MYCKYKCNAKEQNISVFVESGCECQHCHADTEVYIEDVKSIIGDDACRLCQINNFISELKDYNIIE